MNVQLRFHGNGLNHCIEGFSVCLKYLVIQKNFYCLKKKCLDFPGNPAVKTPSFHCWGHGV